ncbi:hypothetical protein FHR83_004847 [Actinoplanes campanulatus]|uniref:Uncharacterized protein n=1 Tax=Actinoplanes campanulatus TaxID=113559 RepID=A0A7W5AJ01_9ACTN|nr:hypothetical protein [Actinoplanes campanulatus]MBB3097172.1 hypothetical protein [Actinoplanes campanulatus]GGN16208.1 hypothetical protein GCM10010109_28310 [Actinoplanes campanulatus]GID37646.1 hypothetical protein Aca09nite_41520 [Actinoplanes campanulatus]
MTGDAPQPAEPPRDQGNPWTLSDPDGAWWHGEDDRDRPDAEDPSSAAAHVAGVRDLTEHLNRLEHLDRLENRDRRDRREHRDRPEPAEEPGPPARLTEPGAAPGGSRLATAGELMIVEGGPEREPRPGVTPLPEVIGCPDVEARLERMENSPFWLTEEERARNDAARADHRPGRRRRPADHNPLSALFALVLLSLVAAFFGWVSAEPFWLAVGHGDRGYATTTHCRGDGLAQRCAGRFASLDGHYSVSRVTLLGISGAGRQTGAVSSARMVSPDSDQAYAAPAGALMHLRWGLGFLLVAICGYGIAEATGARRLPSRPTRRSALIASFLGPFLLLSGFLVAAY